MRQPAGLSLESHRLEKVCMMMKTKLCAAAGFCFAALLANAVFAGEDVKKEEAKPTPPTETKSEVKKEATDPAAAKDPEKPGTPKPPDADPFHVPEGADAKRLVAFCEYILELRKEVHFKAEYINYQTKMRPALKAACEQILNLEKSQDTEIGRYATRNLMGLAIQDLVKASDTEIDAYLQQVSGFLANHPPGKEDAGLTMGIAKFLERNKPAKLKDFYAGILPVMQKSLVPEVSGYAKSLEGAMRRLNLPGNVMELKAETFDGKPFDLASLKGQVVLIDFWASWNQYSVKELPSLKKVYEEYHAKGFEIVGISADQERAKLEEFLQTEKLPWITLYENGGSSAAMRYYSIAELPAGILVGKDGKVLSLTARGDELTRLLKQELDKPDGSSAATPEKRQDTPPTVPAPK